jgi:Zn-dependent oligopeptidase
LKHQDLRKDIENIEVFEKWLNDIDQTFVKFRRSLKDKELHTLMDECDPVLYEFTYNLVLNAELAEQIIKEAWDELIHNIDDENLLNDHFLFTMYLKIINRVKS